MSIVRAGNYAQLTTTRVDAIYIPAVANTLLGGDDNPKRHKKKSGADRETFVVTALDVRNMREQPDGISGTLADKENGSYSLNYQNPVVVYDAMGNGDGEVVNTLTGQVNRVTDYTPIVVAQPLRSNQYNNSDPGMEAGMHVLVTSGPKMVEPAIRRLTPTECERLQGFLDGWTLWDAEGNEISDSARYRMLGNAVAATCARWIGKQIKRVLKK